MNRAGRSRSACASGPSSSTATSRASSPASRTCGASARSRTRRRATSASSAKRGGAGRGGRGRRRVRPRVARGRGGLELPAHQRLIASHNAYYAIEARVPMNPRTGTYAQNWQRSAVHAGVDSRALPPPGPGRRRQVPTRREHVLERRDRRLPAARLGPDRLVAARRKDAHGAACRRARAPASSSFAPSPTNRHSSGRTLEPLARELVDPRVGLRSTRPRTRARRRRRCGASSVSSQRLLDVARADADHAALEAAALAARRASRSRPRAARARRA